MHDLLQKAVALNNAHIEQFKFLRVVCAWTYPKKSLNVSYITYFYPKTAFQYNHSFGFQKPMKVKVVK